MNNFQCRFWLSGLLLLTIYLSASSVVLGQYECQPAAGGGTTTGSLTVSDPTQAGRIVRDGRPSSCTGKTNLAQNTTAVHAKAFNFTNPTGQAACVTVDFDHLGCAANTTANVAYSTYNSATPAANVIGDSGFSSTGKGSYSFPVAAGGSYTIVVHEITPNTGCASFSFTISYNTACRQAGFDGNNDGKAEYTVFRPSVGQWYAFNATAVTTAINTFGVSTDKPMIGDFSGDGNTDLAVFRPSNSTWYVANAPGNPVTNFSATQWGLSGDVPMPGDYDRDGKTDITVWRPSDGNWYVLQSSNNTLSALQWGMSGDTPFTGDFDGDRANDFGVTRVLSGVPVDLILESNFQQGFFLQSYFGAVGDKIAIGDYDGDGKSDLAVFRPSDGNWYINQSSVVAGSPISVTHFGQSGDIPQPADYDGDKKTDIAVYRPSTNVWYVLNSSNSSLTAFNYGSAGDVPVSSPYLIQ
jgi:hypothetical protein